MTKWLIIIIIITITMAPKWQKQFECATIHNCFRNGYPRKKPENIGQGEPIKIFISQHALRQQLYTLSWPFQQESL